MVNVTRISSSGREISVKEIRKPEESFVASVEEAAGLLEELMLQAQKDGCEFHGFLEPNDSQKPSGWRAVCQLKKEE